MIFTCVLLALVLTTGQPGVLSMPEDGHFINSWAAEIRGGVEVAREVAETHGYRLVRSLGTIQDHYLLERSDTPHRSRRSADHHTRKLTEDDRVVFVEQQQHRDRVKREVRDSSQELSLVTRDGPPNDPEFQNEWYLNQADTASGRRDGLKYDLNVQEVWKMGITGRNVTVSVIDDGLEWKHLDLIENYDPQASHDFNDNDDDPQARYDPTNENKHGTRCAGEIAMVANNGICGTGIAPNAKIGGLRILDGTVTDATEAGALSFNNNHVDIYSSSWGPNDDGRTMEGPGRLTAKMLEEGVKKGRNGLGSNFVWAAGNGASRGDHCNADGYTSSIFTLSVSSVSQGGHIPYYSEGCSSTLTTCFSSGSSSEGKVVTSDLHNGCTNGHTGTSAAAPMVAGIIALALEVNPNLTWRDVQHIVSHTSRAEPLLGNPGWYRNGAGYCVNLSFGFGLVDALAVVLLAKDFKSVGEQHICEVKAANNSGFPMEFISGHSVSVQFTTSGCKGQANEINFLEHVVVHVDISHQKRGNIYAELTSPSGTITAVMQERSQDKSKAGMKWAFMSTHNWGESPDGTWTFTVADRSSDNLRGVLKSASITFYGTKEQPEHQKNMISKCPNLPKYADTLTNIVHIDRDQGFGGSYQTLLSSQMASAQTVGKPAPSNAFQGQKKPTLASGNTNKLSGLNSLIQALALG